MSRAFRVITGPGFVSERGGFAGWCVAPRRRAIVALFACLLIPRLQAQTSRPVESTAATTTTTTTTSAPADREPDRYLAVINGRVHTVTGPVLEGATVLSKNGRIVAMGGGVQLPAECEVVDARGMYVYPGLVAVRTTGIHDTKNPDDASDVYGLSMNLALAGGITSGLAGKHAVKMTFGSVDDIVLRRDVFTTLSYSSRKPLERAQVRADLERVRNYLRDLRRHELEKLRNKEAKPPDKKWLKGKYEKYRKLMQHETVATASANTMHPLLDLSELSRQFGFELVIRGAYEGWLVADELARGNVSVILNTRRVVDPNERLNRPTGATIENARILHEHGVRIAIIPASTSITLWGGAGRDLLHLNMEAAFAVRGGLSDEDALMAITIDAARILGIDDRVGSLEIGKDADLIIADGDILHYMTLVHYSIVNGRVAYEKAKDTLFAHIRPDGKPAVPDFDDIWPRRLEWPDESKK